MNFRKLGNTDLEVSAICLGTMTFGEQNSQKDAFEQMDYALDKGVNFLTLLKSILHLALKKLVAQPKK